MQTFGYEDELNSDFLPPIQLWLAVEPLLPPPAKTTKVGRKAKPNQQMFAAIYYRMRTGCQWNALPKCLGAGSTVHDRHQQWVAVGVFERLWEHGLLQLNIEGVLDWSFQSIDSCTTKAPLGGQATGANPTESTISLLGYQDHIKSRGQEYTASQDQPGYRARRWVCERTHSWVNKYRGLLIRWEKKVANYKALLFLACAQVVWRRSIIFG